MVWYKTGPMQGVLANVNPNLNLLKLNFNLSNPTKLDRKLADYGSLTYHPFQLGQILGQVSILTITAPL